MVNHICCFNVFANVFVVVCLFVCLFLFVCFLVNVCEEYLFSVLASFFLNKWILLTDDPGLLL